MTVTDLMAQLGFGPEDDGPNVAALREWAAGSKAARVNAWWTGAGSPDDRAREFLALQWEIEHGLTYRVECIDGWPIYWQTNVRTMKRRLVVRWRWMPAWVADQARRVAFDLRRAWFRARGIRNPYRLHAGQS